MFLSCKSDSEPVGAESNHSHAQEETRTVQLPTYSSDSSVDILSSRCSEPHSSCKQTKRSATTDYQTPRIFRAYQDEMPRIIPQPPVSDGSKYPPNVSPKHGNDANYDDFHQERVDCLSESPTPTLSPHHPDDSVEQNTVARSDHTPESVPECSSTSEMPPPEAKTKPPSQLEEASSPSTVSATLIARDTNLSKPSFNSFEPSKPTPRCGLLGRDIQVSNCSDSVSEMDSMTEQTKDSAPIAQDPKIQKRAAKKSSTKKGKRTKRKSPPSDSSYESVLVTATAPPHDQPKYHRQRVARKKKRERLPGIPYSDRCYLEPICSMAMKLVPKEHHQYRPNLRDEPPKKRSKKKHVYKWCHEPGYIMKKMPNGEFKKITWAEYRAQKFD